MTDGGGKEARCQCCGGYAGHGHDPEYCGTCIDAGEPPDDWTHPAEQRDTDATWNRPNLVKLRGWEFEEVVPWLEIIEDMQRGAE